MRHLARGVLVSSVMIVKVVHLRDTIDTRLLTQILSLLTFLRTLLCACGGFCLWRTRARALLLTGAQRRADRACLPVGCA